MPLVRIELFPGRSAETKRRIAEGVTRLLEETAGIKPSATTVIFQETAPEDWFDGGRSNAAPPAQAD